MQDGDNGKVVFIKSLGPVVGIFLCCVIAVFYLPKTQYAMSFIGNHHFSKFLKSKSDADAKTAFYYWQRAANKQAFIEAFKNIPENSTLWKDYIKRSAQLYHERGNPTPYLDYLLSLQQEFTHPIGESAINFEIGNYYMNLTPAKASDFFNTVIKLNVNRHDTQMARGNIHEIDKLNPGQPSPLFKVLSIEKKKFSPENLHGKIVLIDFWSLKCRGCVQELPFLKEIYSSFETDDFILLMVSLEEGNEVSEFIQEHNIPGHHILIGEDNSADLLQQFNIQYIPTTYILDQNGRIAYKKLHSEQLNEALRYLSTHNQ